MVKRFRRGFRRQKPPMQWLSGTWNENSTTAVAANTLAIFAVVTTGTSRLTTGGDTFVMPQRFTVERVVGQFIVENVSTTTACIWNAGMILTDETAGVALQIDPTLAANSDKSWMWMRAGLLAAIQATPVTKDYTNMNDVPWGSSLDVRVKRVIKPDQTLYIAFKATTDCAVITRYRVLLKRVA